MALLVYAKKVDETSDAVQYRFGGDPDDLDRVLVIDKSTERPRPPEDGPANKMYMAAFGAVVRKRLETGDWPQWAMQAS